MFWGRLALRCASPTPFKTLLGNRCSLCQRSEETIDHLLLHYAVTRILWDVFFLFLEFFGSFLALLGKLWKVGRILCGQKEEVWRAGPLCPFWTIWKARNKFAFEGKVLSIQKMKTSFVYLLWEETKFWIKEGPLDNSWFY